MGQCKFELPVGQRVQVYWGNSTDEVSVVGIILDVYETDCHQYEFVQVSDESRQRDNVSIHIATRYITGVKRL